MARLKKVVEEVVPEVIETVEESVETLANDEVINIKFPRAGITG